MQYSKVNSVKRWFIVVFLISYYRLLFIIEGVGNFIFRSSLFNNHIFSQTCTYSLLGPILVVWNVGKVYRRYSLLSYVVFLYLGWHLFSVLQVLYEHKARLEKTLQAEIERKKSVDDELKTMQSALSKERAVQAEKVAKLQRQNDELKVKMMEQSW